MFFKDLFSLQFFLSNFIKIGEKGFKSVVKVLKVFVLLVVKIFDTFVMNCKHILKLKFQKLCLGKKNHSLQHEVTSGTL